MLELIISIVIFFSGFIFINLNSKELSKFDVKVLNNLWIYHFIFSLIFYFYSQNNSADANGYWRVPKQSTIEEFYYFLTFGPGTKFMYVFNYFPSKVLNLSIFTGMLFYALLGFLGFYFFYKITIKYVKFNSTLFKYSLFPAIFFLPNLHFWTAGVGKDTLMFFSIGMFCFSILNISKRIILLILSLILMYMTRSHVLLLLLFSFSIAFLFSNQISRIKKLFLASILVGLLLYILPSVLKYVSLENVSTINDIIERSNKQASHLSGSNIGSSIDISSYSFPVKVFSFLYRPLYFDYSGLFSLIAATENLILLLITLKLFKVNFFKSIRKSPIVIKGLIFFLFSGTLVFSFSLSNLGIILRMKNMFIPGLIIFILWSLSYKRELKKN